MLTGQGGEGPGPSGPPDLRFQNEDCRDVEQSFSFPFSNLMATDVQEHQMFSPDVGLAVVIGLSKAHNRDSSFVYCLEALVSGEVTGAPFQLYDKDGHYVWENKMVRLENITRESLITFKRKPFRLSINRCYIESTGKVMDINTVLSQLQFGGTGHKAVVFQGISEGFPTVMIENLKICQDVEDEPSPVCALIGVKEATLVERKIKFKTLLDEECIFKNNCQNNVGSGVEEVPLPVQVSLSHQDIRCSNCVLLVKLSDQHKYESSGSDGYYAVCEAILTSQPGPFAQGGRQHSSGGILAGLSPLQSYEMNRSPRGMCIIINNFEFHNKAFNCPGARVDEDALKALFRNLLFVVKIYRNLDSHGMRDLAETIASEDHSKHDAFFFIVMSHRGIQDTVLGVDQRNVTVEDMMSEFKVARCKTLEAKPKVFIFQFCWGSSSKFLVHREHCMDSTFGRLCVDSTLPRGTTPQEADFLLAFATTFGLYQDEHHGSPFIQTLVEVIREHHQDSHLTEILPEVTRRVVEKANRDGSRRCIQVPSYRNSLRFKLYL